MATDARRFNLGMYGRISIQSYSLTRWLLSDRRFVTVICEQVGMRIKDRHAPEGPSSILPLRAAA
jgi:hypothetical protein